ncbi:MAG: hypothetical protein RBU23_13615 [Candidatus Auribacterota bacterium]|nr:hypothetical protein [Candidatus Auribacterota bacterium]
MSKTAKTAEVAEKGSPSNGLRYWRVGRDADSLDRQKKLRW